MTKPTESELSILQILWQLNGATVRTVNDALNKESDVEIGYTTKKKKKKSTFELIHLNQNIS